MAQVKSFSEVEASFQYHQNGHSIFSWVLSLINQMWMFSWNCYLHSDLQLMEVFKSHRETERYTVITVFPPVSLTMEQLKQTSDFTSKIHNPRSPEKSCCWEKVVFIWINDNFRVLQHIYSVLYFSIFGAKVYCIFMSMNLEHCCKAEYNNADLHKS